jgi:hypothetical protein
MFLIINALDFNINNLILSQKMKNNVMNGYFYRLFYSDEHFSSKGLYLGFGLEEVSIEKYFNKLKCKFPKNKNKKIIGFLKTIERLILDIVPYKETKQPVYRIEEQLQNDFLKIFCSNNIDTNYLSCAKLLLRISGIWVNEKDFGVTFRFFFIRQ